LRAADAMIAWTPATDTVPEWGGTGGRVLVVPHPDIGDRARSFRKTDGAAGGYWRDLAPETRIARIMVLFHTMVIRDGIDPAVAHKALLEIDEYAETIDRSIEGSKEVEPHYVGITQDLPDDLVVDLKEAGSVERVIDDILDTARPELGDTDRVIRWLRGALRAELAAERPVHLNVHALFWALNIEGTAAADDAIEARWNSIREALRNA